MQNLRNRVARLERHDGASCEPQAYLIGPETTDLERLKILAAAAGAPAGAIVITHNVPEPDPLPSHLKEEMSA